MDTSANVENYDDIDDVNVAISFLQQSLSFKDLPSCLQSSKVLKFGEAVKIFYSFNISKDAKCLLLNLNESYVWCKHSSMSLCRELPIVVD